MINRDRAKDLVNLRVEHLKELYGEFSPEKEKTIRFGLKSYFMQHWNKDCFPILAEANGKPVACAVVCISERMPTMEVPDTKQAEICELYTSPEYRGKGYATLLVNSCVALAAGMGISQVKLRAPTWATSIYEKCGFEKQETSRAEMQLNLENI